MKFAFRGVSGAALMLGLAGGLQSGWAQQAPAATTPDSPQTITTAQLTPQAAPQAAGQAEQVAPAEQPQGSTDRVVILGSLIATTPEDAPKPVEVYSAEDLANQGSPNITEFIRSLSVNTGGAFLGFGQANPDNPTGAGFNSLNLRGLGTDGTLVLMNGRRLSTTNGGFGADVNTIPMEALEAVEILKDGASATYGAGAVGGVVNFRTRRDIDAPRITVEKTIYDGSDGAYKVDFLTGWVGDASNLMISASHRWEDRMFGTERDFSSQPFSVNPGAWTLDGTNPGLLRLLNSDYNAITTTGTVGGHFLDTVSPATDCAALGGELGSVLQQGTGDAHNRTCAFPRYRTSTIVDETKEYRIYGEFNADVSDTMEFHADVLYSKNEVLQPDEPSGDSGATRHATAVRNPPTTPTGAYTNFTTCNTTTSATSTASAHCTYFVPNMVNYYNASGTAIAGSVQNPFIQDMLTRTGQSLTNPAGGVFLTEAWRPYLFGGNPRYDDGFIERKTQRERIQANVGVRGEFSDDGLFSFFKGITYDYNGQFNQYTQTLTAPDFIISRLHAALNGYGGPGCLAEDAVPTDFSSAGAFNRTVGIQSNIAPGTNGCQWFNPFSSNFSTSLLNGAANPNFNSGAPILAAGSTPRPEGYQNSAGLIDWMMADRQSETVLTSSTFDATWSGQLPQTLELPGGAIGWAAGLQWRQVERRDQAYDSNQEKEDFYNQVCPFPDPSVESVATQRADQVFGGLGCEATGAFFGSGIPVNFGGGTSTPSYSDSQTLAYYAEVQLPVLDNLNLSASIRREEFNGGKIVGDIWGVAGKYDITDNFYVRASYNTNFRANELLDNVPGRVTESVYTTPAITFGSALDLRQTQTIDPNLGAEDDTSMNFGVGYQGDLFGGQLRASVDFFEIVIEGDISTTSNTAVLNNVFYATSDQATDPSLGNNPDDANEGTTAHLADCSARLISFVAFSGGCVQGVTAAADLTNIFQFVVNGGGRITNGLDFAVDYAYPLFDGTLAFQGRATQALVYKGKGYDVNGVPFALDDNTLLGFTNFNNFLSGSITPEWRGNATIRWANERHNVSIRANYMSGVEDDRTAFQFEQVIDLAGTANDVFSSYGRELGGNDYLDFDINYIYTAPFWENLELRVSVFNITDENPPPFQGTNGYLGIAGDPRGRRIELGIVKEF